MNKPEAYERFNKFARDGTAGALKRVGPLIKWKPGNQDTLLDVGCGPGNVLMNVVLPEFKGKYSTCYATDVSEAMVEFTAKKYADSANLKVLQMDIMNVDGFLAEHGKVDHVISSFVVHWLPDQAGGLRNIFRVLKPGGDFVTVHASNAGMFDVYEHMADHERWGQYFDNLKQFIPPSHKSKQPVDDFRKQLEGFGFTEVVVELNPSRITLDCRDSMLTLFSSGHAQISRLPENLRMEYLKEAISYGVESGAIREDPSGEISFQFDLCVAYAAKPE